MAKLQQVVIKDLRPTQLTVGMIEVADKKARLAALAPKDQADFMAAHPMPVVLGPGAKLFITDHHHLARAALEARVTNGFYTVEADLSDHNPDDFWKEMDKNLWVHPLDQHGVRHRRHAGEDQRAREGNDAEERLHVFMDCRRARSDSSARRAVERR